MVPRGSPNVMRHHFGTPIFKNLNGLFMIGALICVWELVSHLDPRTILHKHTVLSTRLTPVNAQATCKTCFIIQCVNEPDSTAINWDGNGSSTSCRFITHAAILRDMDIANVCRTAVPCALTRAAVTAVSGAVCLSTEHGFQQSTKTQADQPWHKILCIFTVTHFLILK